MIEFCLPPTQAEDFKRRIISGEIDPLKLAEMTSAQRHDFFARLFGEAMAGPMNRELESKLLLKNQQQGMINWAKRMMGEGKSAPPKDIVDRIKGLREVLEPEEEDAFLEELAGHKLGIRVTYEEAQRIAELSRAVDEAKARMEAGGDRMEYGRAVVALRNYVGELTQESEKLTGDDFKADPRAAVGRALSLAAGSAKSLKASLDNSAIFRQGWKTLWTHPDVWQRNARRSFQDLARSFGGQNVMDEVNADIYSRPTYPEMQRARLAVGVTEEAYPTSLPEKIPGLRRAYRASEHAYNAFVRRTRADVFDKYLEIAERSGVDLSDEQEMRAIGKLVNSLTGRGELGGLERSANVINNVFFSPRLVKSHIDTLLMHPFDDMSRFTRQQAAVNLLKIVMGSAAILMLARALKKDTVELDSRSADFGKIKIGNTRFDVTAGMGSLVTLASRLATNASKSSTTGRVTPLGTGKYGAPTGWSVLFNFFENKLSPAAAVARDLLKNRDFEGNKPTVGSIAANLAEPMIVSNYRELRDDPKSAPILLAMIADALGITTNTYDGKKKKP